MTQPSSKYVRRYEDRICSAGVRNRALVVIDLPGLRRVMLSVRGAIICARNDLPQPKNLALLTAEGHELSPPSHENLVSLRKCISESLGHEVKKSDAHNPSFLCVLIRHSTKSARLVTVCVFLVLCVPLCLCGASLFVFFFLRGPPEARQHPRKEGGETAATPTRGEEGTTALPNRGGGGGKRNALPPKGRERERQPHANGEKESSTTPKRRGESSTTQRRRNLRRRRHHPQGDRPPERVTYKDLDRLTRVDALETSLSHLAKWPEEGAPMGISQPIALAETLPGDNVTGNLERERGERGRKRERDSFKCRGKHPSFNDFSGIEGAFGVVSYARKNKPHKKSYCCFGSSCMFESVVSIVSLQDCMSCVVSAYVVCSHRCLNAVLHFQAFRRSNSYLHVPLPFLHLSKRRTPPFLAHKCHISFFTSGVSCL